MAQIEEVYNDFETVSTSDTVDFERTVKGIIVAAAGNIVAVSKRDDINSTFTSIPAGTLLRISPKRINATGTTATLVALY